MAIDGLMKVRWLDGGDGNDRIIVAPADQPVFYFANAYGSSVNDNIASGTAKAAFSGAAQTGLVLKTLNVLREGMNELAEYYGNGTIVGGPGDDVVGGGLGDDTLFGGAGNDRLYGGFGVDTMFGEAGDDYLQGFGDYSYRPGVPGFFDKLIDGGEGMDRLYIGLSGTDFPVTLTIGDPASDHFIGSTIIRNVEQITFVGGSGGSVVTGGAYDDDLYDGVGHDVLNGGGGDDMLRGSGSDELDGGAGIDSAYIYTPYLFATPIVFSLSDPSVTQTLGAVTTRNIEVVNLSTGTGDDSLTGGNYDDVLNGGGGDDALDGADGNDELRGGEGVDTLFGGAGDDELYGSSGDTLDGGVGVDLAVVSTTDTSAPLNFVLGNGTGEVSLGGTTLRGIERVNLYAGATNDLIVGGEFADMIDAGYGRDVIVGGAGDDVLDGGYGFDMVNGGAGDDQISTFDLGADIEGGDGIDTLTVVRLNAQFDLVFALGDPSADSMVDGLRVSGVERLNFTGGMKNDTITGGAMDDVLNGHHGDDVLNGAGGDDTLIGYFGSDVLSGGDGNDRLDGGWGSDSLSGGMGDDVIYSRIFGGGIVDSLVDGGAGVDQATIDREHSDGGITLSIADPSVPQAIGGTVVRGIEQLTFFGGRGTDIVTGGALDDVIHGGFSSRDVLSGGDGNDTLTGTYGASLNGGSGDDVLIARHDAAFMDGGAGTDKLVYRVGSPSNVNFDFSVPGDVKYFGTIIRNIEQVDISSSSGFDHITGGALSDTISGGGMNDVLVGGAGDDSLSGGSFDDVLEGGAGDDKIFGDAGKDTLVLSGTSSDYLIEDHGSYLVFADQRPDRDGTDEVYRVEFVRFADVTGSVSDAVAGIIAVRPPLAGDDGANSIRGASGKDTISGLGGDDYLMGRDGDDVLTGGAGKDRLTGGAGADTFVFAAGDSGLGGTNRDYIEDFEAGLDHIDLTAFGPEMTYSTVAVGTDLYLRIDGDGDGLRDMDIQIRFVGAFGLKDGDILL
jgi:Ca2+-binding RTX toxin-like protein